MNYECPYCKSKDTRIIKENDTFTGIIYDCKCNKCGEPFTKEIPKN